MMTSAINPGRNTDARFLSAVVVAVVIAAVGAVLLNTLQKPAEVAYTTGAVRL